MPSFCVADQFFQSIPLLKNKSIEKTKIRSSIQRIVLGRRGNGHALDRFGEPVAEKQRKIGACYCVVSTPHAAKGLGTAVALSPNSYRRMHPSIRACLVIETRGEGEIAEKWIQPMGNGWAGVIRKQHFSLSSIDRGISQGSIIVRKDDYEISRPGF
jgi:hypothetical protein